MRYTANSQNIVTINNSDLKVLFFSLEGDKDTKAADVIKVTYVPSLATFEEDMNELYQQSPLSSTLDSPPHV